MIIEFCTFLGIGVIEMKMLKDYELEVGDIIVYNGREYEFVRKNNNSDFQYEVINLKFGNLDALQDWATVDIIKKDPKKKILQKIEEHKSEIKNLENQLKELNSLKVGEVYKVKTHFTHSGINGIHKFEKNELLYLISKTNFDSFRSNIKNNIIKIELNDIKDYIELVNDPEMKNGLAKFFKGNSE